MISATELALLAAVCEQPAEDTPRLVYADAVEEAGDHVSAAVAAYIRRACGQKVEQKRDWTMVQWEFALRLVGPKVADGLRGWERGFPTKIRLSSVRAWERACVNGLFLRVPVERCEVRGREPEEAAPILPRRSAYRPYYRWFAAIGDVRGPWVLPVEVFNEVCRIRTGPDVDVYDRDAAFSAAWRAFAVAGRTACRQPTAEGVA